MSPTAAAFETRKKRGKRQPTVGWLINRLMQYPSNTLVLVHGQGTLEGMETNVRGVVEITMHTAANKDVDDYNLQYVDGRRPKRRMVVIR